MGVQGESLSERHPARRSEAVLNGCAPQYQDVHAGVRRAIVAKWTTDSRGGVLSAPLIHPVADALFERGDDLRGVAGVNDLPLIVLHCLFLSGLASSPEASIEISRLVKFIGT